MKLTRMRPSGSVEHLRRHVALGELVAGRQQDGGAPDGNRAVEHEAVAVAAVALRVLVGLGDPQARLAAVGRHGTRQLHVDRAAR